MTNRSGGVRSTASPSTPAWTGAGAVDLESRGGPRLSRALAGARRVEDDDAELSAVERRPRAGCMRGFERVGVVRHEHDRGVEMRAAAVVHELQVDRGGARPEHVRGRLQQRSRLGVTVGRLPNGVAVDPERDVVEEEAAVHLGHVDPALDAVGERVERADEIAAVDAEVEREVVAGAGGNADERKPVRECGCGDDGERSVAAGGAERVRAARHGLVDERCEVVVRAQDDHVDAELARPLGEAGARRLAATGLRVDEEHGPPRRIRGRPAGSVIRSDGAGASGEVVRWVARDRARGRR